MQSELNHAVSTGRLAEMFTTKRVNIKISLWILSINIGSLKLHYVTLVVINS